jgi:hypothetical protein
MGEHLSMSMEEDRQRHGVFCMAVVAGVACSDLVVVWCEFMLR